MSKGRNPFSELGGLLGQIADERVERRDRLPLFDYGEMQADGSLRVHSWRKGTFAPGEFGYLVHDTYTEPLTTTYPTVVDEGGHAQFSGSGEHAHPPHIHEVVRPPEMLPLALWPAGTTVAVLWLRGTRPVILGRIAG